MIVSMNSHDFAESSWLKRDLDRQWKEVQHKGGMVQLLYTFNSISSSTFGMDQISAFCDDSPKNQTS